MKLTLLLYTSERDNLDNIQDEWIEIFLDKNGLFTSFFLYFKCCKCKINHIV